MLLRRSELEAIRSGSVSLVFRRWRRPSVKSGGTLRTALGVLAIDSVTVVARSEITPREAGAAGYDRLEDLLATLDSREGEVHRIEVRYTGADPRLRLREDADLDAAELGRIAEKLARLDSASPVGAWTRQVLRAIERHPKLAASLLARRIGFEKAWLKQSVRKLKNLGLTISHETGYELSPRGRAVLAHLEGA